MHTVSPCFHLPKSAILWQRAHKPGKYNEIACKGSCVGLDRVPAKYLVFFVLTALNFSFKDERLVATLEESNERKKI